MTRLFSAAALLLAAGASPATAAINTGFESGSTIGWSGFGTNFAATSYGSFTAATGTHFGVVVAGQGEGVASTLSQFFNLAADQTIRGHVGFQANDYLPFDDRAELTVNDISIWQSSISAVGDFGNSGWVNWSFTAPAAGNYSLKLGVANALDNAFSSAAVLDAVPEPANWALLIAGFGLTGAALRHRRMVLAA